MTQDDRELLRQCIASGQVSADEIVRHQQAGELDEPRSDPEPDHWAVKPVKFTLAFVLLICVAGITEAVWRFLQQ